MWRFELSLFFLFSCSLLFSFPSILYLSLYSPSLHPHTFNFPPFSLSPVPFYPLHFTSPILTIFHFTSLHCHSLPYFIIPTLPLPVSSLPFLSSFLSLSFISFNIGATPSIACGLLLILNSSFIPGVTQRPYGILRIEPGPATCTTKTRPALLLLQPTI